jgi:hypothetical protein
MTTELMNDPNLMTNEEREKRFGTTSRFHKIGDKKDHWAAKRRLRCDVCNELIEFGEYYLCYGSTPRSEGKHLRCAEEEYRVQEAEKREHARELKERYGITPEQEKYVEYWCTPQLCVIVGEFSRLLGSINFVLSRESDFEATFNQEPETRAFYELKKAEIINRLVVDQMVEALGKIGIKLQKVD